MEFNILNQPSCCNPSLPTAIIGAGPIGLAAAAHLQERKLPYFLLEAGKLAHNVSTWEHVKLFSPWEYNIDKAAKRLLEQTDWQKPKSDVIPTGEELMKQYLSPLGELFKDKLYTNHKVVAVTRDGIDKMKSGNRQNTAFLIYVETSEGLKTFKAGAIMDATGTWGNPNPSTSHGVWMQSEAKLKEFIDYNIPNVQKNKELYANKRIAVIGGGHSAINSLLQLVELKMRYPDTQIIWILRKARVEDAFGGGSNDELAARGELGMRIAAAVKDGFVQVSTPFKIQSINKKEEGIQLIGTGYELNGFDRLIVNTGNRPNFEFHRELRYEADAITEAVPALAPFIDPNLHSCGSVEAHGERELRQKEPNFYIVGSKSYGRAPTFLMATGYEQVRSVVAHLAGDTEAATQVQLKLPETGVCHSGGGGCC